MLFWLNLLENRKFIITLAWWKKIDDDDDLEGKFTRKGQIASALGQPSFIFTTNERVSRKMDVMKKLPFGPSLPPGEKNSPSFHVTCRDGELSSCW